MTNYDKSKNKDGQEYTGRKMESMTPMERANLINTFYGRKENTKKLIIKKNIENKIN